MKILYIVLFVFFCFNMNTFGLCKNEMVNNLNLTTFWNQKLSKDEKGKKYLENKNLKMVYSYFVVKSNDDSNKLDLVPDTNNVFLVDTKTKECIFFYGISIYGDFSFLVLDTSNYLTKSDIIARLIFSAYEESDTVAVIRMSRNFNYQSSELESKFIVKYKKDGQDVFIYEDYKEKKSLKENKRKLLVDELIEFNKENKIIFKFTDLKTFINNYYR